MSGIINSVGSRSGIIGTTVSDVVNIEAYSDSTATANTTSGGSWLALPITDTITPSRTSSKILVIVSLLGIAVPDIQAECVRYKIFRDVTNEIFDAANVYYQNVDADDHLGPGALTCPMMVLDTPNTTSTVTYTVYAQTRLGNSCTFCGASGATSTIALIEKA